MSQPPPAPTGLPKRYRVRKTGDYRRIQGRGRRHRATHVLALALRARGPDARVGLTVSKKVGNAVTRNRVKRWLREAVRHERHRLHQSGEVWDVVLIAHSSAATAGLEALRCDVVSVFDRVARGAPSGRSSGGRKRRSRGGRPASSSSASRSGRKR